LATTLFVVTIVVVVFFVWTFTVTSPSDWSGLVAVPVLQLTVLVPMAGALVSVLVAGYWYTHREWLSERATLVWLLALATALLGVPVACAEVVLGNVNTRNTTWLAR
jgi:hypothetical protein